MFFINSPTEYSLNVIDSIPNFYDRFLKNNKNKTPAEIMEEIQNAYEDNEFDIRLTETFNAYPFDGYVFNDVDEWDFMEYCIKKYNVNWIEKTIYSLQT